MVGTFLVRSGVLTSVHAFAVDPERGSFILALLAIYIGGALTLFGVRAGTVTEGKRFALVSREGALVFNNVMLSAILGIVLFGTLYPLLAEAMGAKVSVGPPYFNPMGALFAVPMLLVLIVGPLLRWRQDNLKRVAGPLAMPWIAMLMTGAITLAATAWVGLLPWLGLALATGLGIAAFLPLRGRNLRRTPLPVWGMVLAHFGVAVTLFGMASESAFSIEKLVAAKVGDTAVVGPWRVSLDVVEPVAGPNWTALQGGLSAKYQSGEPILLEPQARSFWSPPQQTSEAALATRWNGQLYAVIGDETEDGRWQLRLWWKPFVTMIWYGSLLIAAGGLLALLGRVLSDVRRSVAREKIAYRRERQGR
jgi:cytochrome c-type biogenesis protein CcmF